MISRFTAYLRSPIHIAPLVIFRIMFGALMFISVTRFILKGWVYNMYVLPKMFFPYYGFEWVQPLPEAGMYLVFALLLLFSLGIMFGALYRLSATAFFILFTYVELIDKTNYLNHYYFVSLVSFLLIFLPAAHSFSVDNHLFRRREVRQVPMVHVFVLRLQMFIVYFFAGVAKLNEDWLMHAQPLKIWLPAFSHFPVVGRFMEDDWLAYFFSWFGCVYDLCIGFLLFNRRTVYIAYFFVVVFHLATGMLFNIGMFPYIMMTITIIFFRDDLQRSVLHFLKRLIGYRAGSTEFSLKRMGASHMTGVFFTVFFLVQILLPFRYLLYEGDLFWTEQGYRFSWRVMLMEKAGTAFFYVEDKKTGRVTEVDNKEHLTYMQEKMMATQPDMMVDYARYLRRVFQEKGMEDPIVRAQSYVTLNGRGSREFIDPEVDLSAQSNSFLKEKTWILKQK